MAWARQADPINSTSNNNIISSNNTINNTSSINNNTNSINNTSSSNSSSIISSITKFKGLWCQEHSSRHSSRRAVMAA